MGMRDERPGRIDPTALVAGRLQLHHAAQIVAAVGRSHLDPLPDDSHPNLGFARRERILVGHPVPTDEPFHAGLRVDDLSLTILDADGGVVDAYPLTGRSFEEGLAWMGERTRARDAPLVDGAFAPPPYALPRHPVAEGAPFDADRAVLEEIGRWLADAERALGVVVDAEAGASAVRCWPHHFDLATLIVVTSRPNGEATSTVGVGLSLGDDSYAEPYWYVSPWPQPGAGVLPALSAGGRWHTDGFTAAVLTGSDLVKAGDAGSWDGRVDAFLRASIQAARSTLD